MTRLWLFDFDGTLVDSEKVIKSCYLRVGQELAPERFSFIEAMEIGPTLDESSRMILTDKNLHLLDEFKKRFQQLYDDKLVFETPQFPNVDKTLKQLKAQGDHLCIVTNKRSIPTNKLINYYAWDNYFLYVACIDDFQNIKHKSEMINLMKINYSNYDDIYFVGDTFGDGIAANSLKIPFILANYGYGNNQDWGQIVVYKKIEQINEILKF